MQKSVTLIELLISLVLIGVVILAVFGIYNASSGFFTSSDTKSVVLNEMAYLLDHIDKNVFLAIGWSGGPVNEQAIRRNITAGGGFEILIRQDKNDPPTPIDFNDDIIITYTFDLNNHTITYEENDPSIPGNPDPGTQKVLTNKLIQHSDPAESLTINYNVADGVLTIDNLCLQHDLNDSYDPKTNPNICITSQRFSTSMQSLN